MNDWAKKALMVACWSVALTGVAGPKVKVLAWHIHAGLGAGSRDIERTRKVLQDHPADVVVLFSADKGTARAKKLDQAAVLAEAVGMTPYFRESMPYDGGSYGDAILFKGKHRMVAEKRLPDVRREEPRFMRDHLIALAGWPGSIRLGMAHLSYASANHAIQAEAVNAYYRNVPDQPVIMVANTYTKAGTPAHFNLSIAWEEIGDPEKQLKFPAKNPTQTYLHLFVRPFDAWRVVSTTVIPETMASQSRPLLVELEYVGARAKR